MGKYVVDKHFVGEIITMAQCRFVSYTEERKDLDLVRRRMSTVREQVDHDGKYTMKIRTPRPKGRSG